MNCFGKGETLKFHQEFLWLTLDNGISIQYGSSDDDKAIFEDYLKDKKVLKKIIESIKNTTTEKNISEEDSVSLRIPVKDMESGYLIRDEEVLHHYQNIFYIGDTESNNPSRGFISFDISGLPADITIESAEFTTAPFNSLGNAYTFFPVGIFLTEWGAVSIFTFEYDLPGVLLGECENENIICNSGALKDELQNKINAGAQRFQIMVYLTGIDTNGDSHWDGWSYAIPEVNLDIVYRP